MLLHSPCLVSFEGAVINPQTDSFTCSDTVHKHFEQEIYVHVHCTCTSLQRRVWSVMCSEMLSIVGKREQPSPAIHRMWSQALLAYIIYSS